MFKTFYLVSGTISLGIGFVGLFLPVLPTTPFVLLSIYLFGKGHPEKVEEVLNHPRFKPYIFDYISILSYYYFKHKLLPIVLVFLSSRIN